MDREQLETWASSHNYPQLVLSEGDVVRSGRENWQALLNDTSERIDRALDRLNAFMERLDRTEENK